MSIKTKLFILRHIKTLVLVAVLIVAAVLTNPGKERHARKIAEAKTGIGAAGAIASLALSRQNYVVCSTASVGGNVKSFGMFGLVVVF